MRGRGSCLLCSLVMTALLLCGCQEDGETGKKESAQGGQPAGAKKATAPIQQIAKGFYDYRLPEPPPPPPAPVVEEPVEEIPVEEPPVAFPDPRPLMREEQARKLRGLRRFRHSRLIDMARREKETVERKADRDYQQWEGATFPENRTSLPVDRSRILTADMMIPVVLEGSINTQLAGRVVAVVERDVLSPNGRFVLLPSWTRIICHYEPLEEMGQSRLALRCKRFIRPDGASGFLEDAEAADLAGRTGLIGDLDTRMWEKYGSAFVLAGISALSQAGSNKAKNQAISASANELARNMGEITGDVLARYLDLRPILTIPAGSRFQILPTRDIVFRPLSGGIPAGEAAGRAFSEQSGLPRGTDPASLLPEESK